MTLRDVLRVAVWFALITGIGAVALIGIGKYLLHHVTLVSPQVVWFAPLTFVILAVPTAFVLWGLGRWLPRLFGAGGIVFVLATAGAAYGLMAWGKELHDVSLILLSLGIGVQFGGLARSKPDRFRRLVGRTMPALIALPVLLAVGVNAGGAIRERRAIARLPTARAGAPNVLLIILDTVRDLSTSFGDAGRPTTPAIQRFATTGITFERAISPSSWTLASHASMFTGRPLHELSAGWAEPLDGTWPTLAEYLRAHGYRTGAVVGNFFYGNSEWGLARGFIHYQDYVNSLGHGLLSLFVTRRLVQKLEASGLEHRFWFHRINGRRIAPDVRNDLVRWLDRDRDRPWFAFVNFYDAHDPYVAPKEFEDTIASMPRLDSLPIKRRVNGALHDVPAERRDETIEALDQYEAAILYLDDQIGLMLDDLESRGLLENTLVIVTSDHGEEFMEHGYRWHGQTVFMPAIHVPLIVRMPGRGRAGEHVRVPVSLTNLPASIVQTLGIDSGSPFPGRSFLAPALADSSPRPVFAEVTLDDRGEPPPEEWYRAVIAGPMQYIRAASRRERLYDVTLDPLEQIDLATTDSTRLPTYRSLLDQRPAVRERQEDGSGGGGR